MELVPPLVADDNCLGFLLLALGRVSLLQSVVNEQLHILGLVRVDHVKKYSRSGRRPDSVSLQK